MKMLIPAIAAVICLASAGAASAQTPVPVGPFDSVQLRGGGKVVVRHGPRQSVSLRSGSLEYSSIEVRKRAGDTDQLTIRACVRRCPLRYDLVVEIVTPRLPAVAITGGGLIVAEPGFASAANASAAVKGGGMIDLRAVQIGNASAAVHGGGKIELSVRKSLSAAVMGGGLIRYRGNPAVSSAINGGGSVVRGR